MLVILVLFLFLGNVRSSLIVTATLVVAPLATFIVMDQVGLTANLMSLGGLVIAIGMMVDGSVVVVENVYRHLSEQTPVSSTSRIAIVLKATKKSRNPSASAFSLLFSCFCRSWPCRAWKGRCSSRSPTRL